LLGEGNGPESWQEKSFYGRIFYEYSGKVIKEIGLLEEYGKLVLYSLLK
jgi:hypothetical protein